MGRLTTHVLNVVTGKPGAGIKIDLYAVDGERHLIKSVATNQDGRCDAPILEGEEFVAGIYEIEFHAGDYFRAAGTDLPDPAYVDVVVIRFGIAAPDEHYHVPLLVTPWSYSTYRGS